MKRLSKIALLLFFIITCIIIGIIIKNRINEQAEYDKILESIGEENSWHLDTNDFSEEGYLLFNELMTNGLSYTEALEISNPEKYDELSQLPFAFEYFKGVYKDDFKIPPPPPSEEKE